MDVAAQLRSLAASGATGQLDIVAAPGEGRFWLSGGRVSAVALSTARPGLGMRLVSGGVLSLTSLGAALSTQQQHPQMRLGDILVRMGLASRQDIEAVAWEQMCDDTLSLLNWPEPAITFRAMRPEDVPPGAHDAEELLAAAADRARALQQIVGEVGGADTVPALADVDLGKHDSALRPMEWAVLCRVDGRRTLKQIADQAGLTTFEAGGVLQALLAAGLVTVPRTVLPPATSRPAPWPAAPEPVSAGNPNSIYDDPADLLRELSQLGGLDTSSRRRGTR